MAESRVPIKITVRDVGEAKGEIIKIRAPLTASAIANMLPLDGRLHAQPGGYSFIIGIKRGTEKAVNKVDAGTIAYWPMQDAIVIYTEDIRPYSPVNKVGEVSEGLEVFKDLKSGTRIKIERA